MLRCLYVLLVVLCPLRTDAEILRIPAGDTQTLIEALRHQERDGRGLEIQLAAGAVYVFQGPWHDGAATALPPITGRVRLSGHGSQLMAYAAGPLGLIEVAEAGQLVLGEITLSGASGTALRNAGESRLWRVRIEDNFAVDRPSAIDNLGQMQIDDCHIAFNTSQGAGEAAAIRNRGWLTFIDGSIGANRLYVSPESGPAAVALWNTGQARLMRVELSDNEVVPIGPSTRGALLNAGAGRMELRQVRLLYGDTAALAQGGPGSASVLLHETTVANLWPD